MSQDGPDRDALIARAREAGFEAIRSALKSSPDRVLDCAFGNAIWDREMLAMSKHPFAINPTPHLKEIAIANGWRLYQPEPNRLGQEA